MDVELTIDRIGPAGEGVARHDGRDVHVAGAFLGERIRARLGARSRHHARAHASVLEVLAPHAGRRASPCPRAGLEPGQCGGCPWITIDEAGQRAQARAMLDALGLSVDEVRPSPLAWGYRRASKRVAYAHRGALRLGSWSPRTHVGASMRGCLVDPPRVVEAFDELEAAARQLGVTAYDEASRAGELRYAWAREDGGRLILTLITAAGDPRPLADALRVPDAVAHSRQAGESNAIRGEAPVLLRGDYAGTPLGFTQPNPAAIERAIDALLETEGGDPVTADQAWDLYAGAGAITARLRGLVGEVLPCERYPAAAEALGVAPQDVLERLREATEAPPLVIANPPRKGMGEAVCAELARLAPPRLHVMSCGPRGLADDRDRLVEAGYRATQLLAFQSLPQTPHVELVLKLVRDPAA